MKKTLIIFLTLLSIFSCNKEIENNITCIIVNPENQVEKPYFETILIEVDAKSEDGIIEKVDFYINGNLAGTAINRPFFHQWEDSVVGDYTIKATAFDSNGNSKSDEIEVMVIEYGNLQDVEENFYKTVKIGGQIWMNENLKTSRFNDGKTIKYGKLDSEWSQINPPKSLQCWYDNNSEYENPYGRLYNWYAVETEKLCPQGWSVPTYNDWEVLSDYLEPNAGGKLKNEGYKYWKSPNVGATNDAKFNAVPAGLRHNGGKFEYLGEAGIWWTSDSYNLGDAFRVYVNYNSDTLVNRFWSFKLTGLSVRCIKDQ